MYIVDYIYYCMYCVAVSFDLKLSTPYNRARKIFAMTLMFITLSLFVSIHVIFKFEIPYPEVVMVFLVIASFTFPEIYFSVKNKDDAIVAYYNLKRAGKRTTDTCFGYFIFLFGISLFPALNWLNKYIYH